VVHLLDRYGLEPNRMSAIGYGEFQPIADNATLEGRQKNRRVVLVVLGSQHSRRSLEVFSPLPKATKTNKPSQVTTPKNNPQTQPISGTTP
jgi:chemotaxis protein MotB